MRDAITPENAEQLNAIIDAIEAKAAPLNEALHALPRSREASIAVTKLEECLMWMSQAVLRDAERKAEQDNAPRVIVAHGKLRR